MKVSLNVIVDVSGSMEEMGKIHLQRNLCRCIAQLPLIDPEKYSTLDLRFYQWGECISALRLSSDGDIPTLNAHGSACLTKLSEFLAHCRSDFLTEQMRVLLLSDGHFPTGEISTFRQIVGSSPGCILRTVAVGADADLLKLKKISTKTSVHLAENIVSALDEVFFGADQSLSAPKSMAQVLETKSADSSGDWDE